MRFFIWAYTHSSHQCISWSALSCSQGTIRFQQRYSSRSLVYCSSYKVRQWQDIYMGGKMTSLTAKLKIRTKLERCPNCGIYGMVLTDPRPYLWFNSTITAHQLDGVVARCCNEKCNAVYGVRGGWLVCLNYEGEFPLPPGEFAEYHFGMGTPRKQLLRGI